MKPHSHHMYRTIKSVVVFLLKLLGNLKVYYIYLMVTSQIFKVHYISEMLAMMICLKLRLLILIDKTPEQSGHSLDNLLHEIKVINDNFNKIPEQSGHSLERPQHKIRITSRKLLTRDLKINGKSKHLHVDIFCWLILS